MRQLVVLAKEYLSYLKYWPYVLDAMRSAYVNWPQVVASLMIRDAAVGRARDGTSWRGDFGELFSYAKLVAHAGCGVVAASQDTVELWCHGRDVDVKLLKIFGWRGTDLFTAIADYKGMLGPSIRGKSVLDVGAYVGDSSLLFAAMGARRVVAVEPSPWAYSVARENVEVNRLGDVITLLNCAVAREDGRVLMLPATETGLTFKAEEVPDGDVPVPTCTLDTLIEKYGPFDVMKMDCEGCEYESILYSRRIGELREVLIEYHDGYEPIARKLLDAGFRVLRYSRFGSFSCKRPEELSLRPVDPRLGCIYAAR